MRFTKLVMLILIAGMLISAGGCGGPLIKPNIINTQTFDASYDKVWKATVHAFAEKDVQVSALEKESGFIAILPANIDFGYFGDSEIRKYVVCPEVFCAIWQYVQMRGNAIVINEHNNEEETLVKLNFNFMAWNRNEYGGGGKWYGCYSKGLIERKYLKAIEEKLGADTVFGGTFNNLSAPLTGGVAGTGGPEGYGIPNDTQYGGQGSTVDMAGSSFDNPMAVYGAPNN